MSEASERRRRWINLAEFVAVAGLIIAALGLYNTWSDRRDAVAEKQAAAAGEAEARARFELKGVVSEDRRSITLQRDERHALMDVRVTFPAALKVPPKDAVGHLIEADWFDAPLLQATDNGPDERVGRLPVLVTYSYTVDDDQASRTAVYDIVWRTDGRLLRGRSLAITGFRLRERGGDQARIDALWARELKAS